MKKAVLVLINLAAMVPLLTGCWDQRELTDLAFITGMGIDKGSDGQYIVSLEIVIPGNIAAGQTGSSGQGIPVITLKGPGKNLTEAVRKLTKEYSRRPYYAHTNLLIVSEDVAKAEVLNLFDGVDRDPEFRTSASIVIAKGTTAANLLSILSNIEKIPVAKIVKTVKSTEFLLGENERVTIDDFISAMVSSGKEASVTGFVLSGSTKIGESIQNNQFTIPRAVTRADGLAMFREGKLVGWLDHNKARGAMWVMNKVTNTDINVDWKGKEKAVSVISNRAKAKISATIRGGKPIIDVLIQNEGNLSELNAPIDLSHQDEINIIEQKVAASIKKEVFSAIKEAQKRKSDIFGFGEKVHRKDPELWKKLKKDWDEHFAALEVHVQVKSYIRREGIRANPFWTDLPPEK